MLVSAKVANTSSTAGSEVLQAYIARISPSEICRPKKELRGFTKVFVPPFEEKRAVISLQVKHAVSVWDEAADAWLMEAGLYEILIGNSSASISQRIQFSIATSLHWSGL
jgi:beta-glucosidase